MKPSLSVLAALLMLGGLPAAAVPPTPPDLTQGGKKDDAHDWTLGPTGARGWIWGRGLETTEARQVLVTKVENPPHRKGDHERAV